MLALLLAKISNASTVKLIYAINNNNTTQLNKQKSVLVLKMNTLQLMPTKPNTRGMVLLEHFKN